ncbi:MAG TPA: acetyltransferase [Stenomitos sp.]
MFLKDKETNELVKVLDLEALHNPLRESVSGALQAGQEEQPPQDYAKTQLQFPSGENLPLCWQDANYTQA